MWMDLNNPVVQLVVQGTQAEFRGDRPAACGFYQQAWELATNDLEACIAAHYVARCQDSPPEALRWNQEALDRADRARDERVQDFYPSLYLNMGQSYERMGRAAEAQRYYRMAAELGADHQMDGPESLQNGGFKSSSQPC